MSENNGKTAAAETEEAMPTPPAFERTLILTFSGDQVSCHVDGGTVFEAPALLRRGAKKIEAELTGE